MAFLSLFGVAHHTLRRSDCIRGECRMATTKTTKVKNLSPKKASTVKGGAKRLASNDNVTLMRIA